MIVLSVINMQDELVNDKINIVYFDPGELKDLKEKISFDRIEALCVHQSYIKEDFLSLFPELKWVQVPSSGYDRVDIQLLKNRNIILTNGRGAYSVAIAEDIFSKMLLFARNVDTYVKDQKQKKWQSGLDTFELQGKTIGILGAGSIGKETALRAKCFGMKTLGVNTSGNKVDGFDLIYPAKSMDKLLAESDFVICALPLNQETRGLINRDSFKIMKKSSFFINVGRGPIVVEKDLIQALKEKEIAGAGLDVFEEEPLDSNSPLWQLPNVYITPHQAGRGDHSRDKVKEIFAHNLKTYPDKEEMINVVT